MSQIDINGLLAQMRTLAAQSGIAPAGPASAPAAGGVDFGQMLKQTIDHVDASSKTAMQLTDSFARGEPGTDLPQVMVAMQKADLSFRAMNEVRNRLVEAYRDVMNMQM